MRRHGIMGRLALVGVICVSATLACVVVKPPDRREVVVVRPDRGHGPPPHAPAHGYRRKFQQDGVTLELDSGRGVYVVVGIDDLFFFDKRYYRCDDKGWFASARPDGGWVVIAVGDVPSGLRDYKPKHAKHGKPVKGKKKH